MASFIKFVTAGSPVSASDSLIPGVGKFASSPEIKCVASPEPMDNPDPLLLNERQPSSASAPASGPNSAENSLSSTPSVSRRQSLRRALSYRVAKASRALRQKSHDPIQEGTSGDSAKGDLGTSSDVAGGRFSWGRKSSNKVAMPQERYAGDPSIYEDIKVSMVPLASCNPVKSLRVHQTGLYSIQYD